MFVSTPAAVVRENRDYDDLVSFYHVYHFDLFLGIIAARPWLPVRKNHLFSMPLSPRFGNVPTAQNFFNLFWGHTAKGHS
jgi:hypothetical protein